MGWYQQQGMDTKVNTAGSLPPLPAVLTSTSLSNCCVCNRHNQTCLALPLFATACPADTQWVIATNGDNEYDPGFIPAIEAAPADVDIIAFDFYSRYQRVTGTWEAPSIALR